MEDPREMQSYLQLLAHERVQANDIRRDVFNDRYVSPNNDEIPLIYNRALRDCDLLDKFTEGMLAMPEQIQKCGYRMDELDLDAQSRLTTFLSTITSGIDGKTFEECSKGYIASDEKYRAERLSLATEQARITADVRDLGVHLENLGSWMPRGSAS